MSIRTTPACRTDSFHFASDLHKGASPRRVRSPARVTGLLALATGILLPSTLHAGDPVAEALCDEGYRLMKEERAEEACPKFEQALRLAFSARCQINLAACHEKTGKLATALSEFKEALETAKRDKHSGREDLASERIEVLESRVPQLSVRVSPKSEAPGLVVTLDGRSLPPAAWGVPINVDPGPHRVIATGPGRDWFEKTVRVAEMQQTSVEIPPLQVLGPVVWPVWFRAEDPKQTWSLRARDGTELCRTPCLRGVPKESGYALHLSALDGDRKLEGSVGLPNYLPYWSGEPLTGTAKATISRNGLRAVPILVGGLLGLLGTTLVVMGAISSPRTSPTDTFYSLGGSFVGVGLGVTMLMFAVPQTSLDPSLRFDRSPWPAPAAASVRGLGSPTLGLQLSW